MQPAKRSKTTQTMTYQENWDIERTHEVTHERKWGMRIDPDGSMNCDPCPYCGNEDVFNVVRESTVQYVQANHEKNERFIEDDIGNYKITFVRCNNCEKALWNKENHLYE